MPIQPCPSCGQETPRHLDHMSKGAVVDYYRCECGHVWTIDKQDPSHMTHVTALPKRDASDAEQAERPDGR